MKRATVQLAFLAFVTASLLSSCAFLQKGEFSERKYYNFPRSKHTTEQTASVRTNDKVSIQPVIVREEQKAAEPVVSASVNKKEILLAKPELKKEKRSSTEVKPVVESKETKPAVISFKKSEIRKEAKKAPQNSYRGEPALMLFLAVVASVFFPPLGVYIKDHRTNKWFWITLLLCLSAGGITFLYTGGLWALFWLAAVVIALMVVFDIL